MTNNISLEGFNADFHTWKNHPVTKAFFSCIKNEIEQQINCLSNIYVIQAHPEDKLIALGAHSHVIKVLKSLLEATAEDVFTEQAGGDR